MHINNNKISSQAAFFWGKQNANLSCFLDYGRGMEDERFGFFLPSMLRMQTSISDHLSWCLSYAKSNLCTVTDTVGCCRFALCSWNDIFKLANKRRVVWCSIGPPLMMLRWCISPGWPEVLLCLPAQRDTMRNVSKEEHSCSPSKWPPARHSVPVSSKTCHLHGVLFLTDCRTARRPQMRLLPWKLWSLNRRERVRRWLGGRGWSLSVQDEVEARFTRFTRPESNREPLGHHVMFHIYNRLPFEEQFK